MTSKNALKELAPPAPEIPNHGPALTALEESFVMEAFRSGWISFRGPYVTAFEDALRGHFGKRHACAVSSGTAALHLALKSLGIGPGDEVVVPDLTFIAVANAVLYCGAVPVMADVHPDYWCLDPVRAAEAIGPRTKAVIVVHGFGHPADMDPLLAAADAKGIPVIEDVSQAFGALYKERKAGSMGRIAVHSFYGNKIITTGEGGALVTDDPDIHARADRLRNHCESPNEKFLHESVGFNYRISNLHAAIGCAQMLRVEKILSRRREILAWYREGLEGLQGISLNPSQAWATPVNWLACVRIEGRTPAQLRTIRDRMTGIGVEIRPNFVPLHRQPALADLKPNPACPVSDRLSGEILMFPSGSALMRSDVDTICVGFRDLLR